MPLARRITVFLVNDAPAEVSDRPPATPLLVFQPQLRVVLGKGMALRNLLSPSNLAGSSEEEGLEEASLALLYHDRPVLARGHMCAAFWRDIDPEREGEAFPALDVESFPVDQRASFSDPDLRSAHLPMVPVCAPDMSWNDSHGPPPTLDPHILAQCWDPDEIEKAIRPLQVGYAAWIATNRAPISTLASALQPTAERHLALCEELAGRIGAGIELLKSDVDVRLAFCFANEAMGMQSSWRGTKLSWRPFQLAFILLCLPGVASPTSPERGVCDLLWFPTGGGKTEAYLGLSAFTFGLRRLRASRDERGRRTGSGTAVISRYTLRLLTIQQFRRALRVVLACEALRVQKHEGKIGWRPSRSSVTDDWLWGTHRFSAGLWVGGGVTPNYLEDIGYPDEIPGALHLLRESKFGHGEPAQVPQCPACDAPLAVPQPRHPGQERPAYPKGQVVRFYLAVYVDGNLPNFTAAALSTASVQIRSFDFIALPSSSHLLEVEFVASGDGVSAREIDDWWNHVVRLLPGISRVESARASRPGYFLRSYKNQQRKTKEYDFEVYCPNPRCSTAQEWREAVPVPLNSNAEGWQTVHECFRSGPDPTLGIRIPIPARTIDDQIYGHPPCLVVSTVDKFARLAYEPRAASIFGNVEYYHARHGYYRLGAPPGAPKVGEDHPAVKALASPVSPLPPPDLIIQDELHLIDGPLGSMVGLYECAIEELCRASSRPVGPKYIASTATVREAEAQVQSLFARRLAQFPAPGLRASDNFFARVENERCDDGSRAGRLYIGVCAPGKGGQTPTVRIWAALLQAVEEARLNGVAPQDLDSFWTLVGYFNAVRELAAASALYRQDVRQRIESLAGSRARDLHEPVELSSRADALLLPSLLSMLESSCPEAVDAVLATSMFGTGVDVDRLGLMVVHGQPKTSSSYIQATGRVGRKQGGFVVAFLSASRPRDLDHYEFFTGYHRQLYRAVEPVTVSPFSPRARERALGPLCVALLRQASEVDGATTDFMWRIQQGSTQGHRSGSGRMAVASTAPEVKKLPEILEKRAQIQPPGRRPQAGVVKNETSSEIDCWKQLAQKSGGANGSLLYYEHAMTRDPVHPVVLGDAQHERRQLGIAYENAPTSLRDVEATTGFKV